MSAIEVTAVEYAERLRVLCARNGPCGWPRRRRDQLILLHALAATLAAGEGLPERALTERIRAWLAGPGAAFDIDAVSLRRYLVDDGFLDRDASGRAYVPGERWTRLLAVAALH